MEDEVFVAGATIIGTRTGKKRSFSALFPRLLNLPNQSKQFESGSLRSSGR
jgi:hypothetical protein